MLASAGCNHIYLGIESGSPRIQKLIRKNLDLQRAVETVKLISEAGIEFTASFIMGFPEETMSDLLKTVDLMLSLRYAGTGNESIQLHLLAPAPGTLLHHNNRLNLRFDGRFSDIALPNLLPDDLELITRHPDVFSAYYYYDTPNIERTDLLCLHHFLTTLNVLPYTTYVLWKDERFHFPTMFFEHIDAIHLAEDERFDPTSITDV